MGALREAEATLDESRATVLRLQVWICKCEHGVPGSHGVYRV